MREPGNRPCPAMIECGPEHRLRPTGCAGWQGVPDSCRRQGQARASRKPGCSDREHEKRIAGAAQPAAGESRLRRATRAFLVMKGSDTYGTTPLATGRTRPATEPRAG